MKWTTPGPSERLIRLRGIDPARFEARLREVSSTIDSSNPDLSAFFARGGKLILRKNMGDLAQSPPAGIAYFESVVARLGRAASLIPRACTSRRPPRIPATPAA